MATPAMAFARLRFSTVGLLRARRIAFLAATEFLRLLLVRVVVTGRLARRAAFLEATADFKRDTEELTRAREEEPLARRADRLAAIRERPLDLDEDLLPRRAIVQAS